MDTITQVLPFVGLLSAVLLIKPQGVIGGNLNMAYDFSLESDPAGGFFFWG
jgi:hypothetical protein